MDAIYERQKDISMTNDIKVAVIGCGGVGFWVSKFLAMSGVTDFHLFDDDVLETSNLNRIDLPAGALGMNKSEATKIAIGLIRPDAMVKTVPFKFKPEFLKDRVDIIVDCTDLIASQKVVYEHSKAKGIKYVKVGYDGCHVTISSKIAGWGDDEGGYHITPSWVVPAVVAAALAAGAILKYAGKELSADISCLYRIV